MNTPQIGMDFLLRLDIPRAMPIFRNYLMVTHDLVVHPDAREEASLVLTAKYSETRLCILKVSMIGNFYCIDL